MPENSTIRSYRDLEVWQKAKSYAVLIYKATDKFPAPEVYGFSSQMRRVAVSLPSNIAEGFRRKSIKEKMQFLRVAYGSGAELETQLEIGYDLGYVDKENYSKLATELERIMKMMNKAIQTIERN